MKKNDDRLAYAKQIVMKCRLDVEAFLRDISTERAVPQLKQEAWRGPFTGGVKLPMALAELGLIDAYESLVHPSDAGHGPTLFAGLSKPLD